MNSNKLSLVAFYRGELVSCVACCQVEDDERLNTGGQGHRNQVMFFLCFE